MTKDLEKMLMKKQDSGKMSDEAKQAKSEVLQELIEMCMKAMGDNVKSGMDEMQKVSVMAPDKESLLEGLDKAKEVAESPMMEKMEEMSEEMPEEEAQEEKQEEKPEMKMVEEDEDESPFNRKMKKMLK